MKNRLMILSCVTVLLAAQGPSVRADEVSPENVAADILVGRPLCLAATVVGTALFVVALPVALISKSVRQTGRALVVRPAEATFTRDLGDFSAL